MNLAFIFHQPQCNTMHRRVSPPLIEESSRPIKMLEIIFVPLGSPKLHICNLKIAPKMTCTVSIGFDVVVRPPLAIDNPLSRIIWMLVFRMRRHKFLGLGPQRWYTLGCIIEIDGETVSLVVILHPAKDVVVYVAEEMHLWLNAPIVAYVFEGWVFVEHAAVPAAHLVIGHEGPVLYVLFL